MNFDVGFVVFSLILVKKKCLIGISNPVKVIGNEVLGVSCGVLSREF